MSSDTQIDRPLDAGQLDEFERKGFLILKGVLLESTLSAVRGAFADVVEQLAVRWKQEGLISDTCENLTFEARYGALRAQVPAKFITSWRRTLVSRPIYELWRRPELLTPIRSLVGDEVFAHGTWNGRPREPKAAIQKINWHQDAYYFKDWRLEDGRIITVWIPLVPVDAQSGCLQFMTGSNQAGFIPPAKTMDNLFGVPDEVLAAYQPFTAVMQPGDVVLFNDLTLHQALANQSDYVRWSIDIRFAPANAAIMSKSDRGYICFSAKEPERVDSFEAWAAKYGDAQTLWYASGEMTGDIDADAARLGVSKSELEVF
jgi:ectoine hydroxylase-related dioxygenase (phytanoyl-CoA dioxygenase family)